MWAHLLQGVGTKDPRASIDSGGTDSAYWIPDFWEAPLRVCREAVPCQEMRNIPNYEEIQKHDLVAGRQSWCWHFCYFWGRMFSRNAQWPANTLRCHLSKKHKDMVRYGEKRLELPSGRVNLRKDQSSRSLWVIPKKIGQKLWMRLWVIPKNWPETMNASKHRMSIQFLSTLFYVISRWNFAAVFACQGLGITGIAGLLGQVDMAWECLGQFFTHPWDLYSYLIICLMNGMNWHEHVFRQHLNNTWLWNIFKKTPAVKPVYYSHITWHSKLWFKRVGCLSVLVVTRFPLVNSWLTW